MKINIAICDDEQEQIDTTEKYIKTYVKDNAIEAHISTYPSAEAFLTNYEKNKFDILFLDIEMKGMDGIELATKLRNQKDRSLKIIYISNYPKYMQSSFNVHPFNFLTKPISYTSLRNVMNEIKEEMTEILNTKLPLIINKEIQLIDIKELHYIETVKSKKKMLSFHFRSHTVLANGTLAEWNEKLNDFDFLTPYKGILLNPSYILVIGKNTITLTNNETLPLSRSYAEKIKTTFLKRVSD